MVVEDEWGEPVDPKKLEDALNANPDAKVVAFVQAETSTGALSDARTLAGVAQRTVRWPSSMRSPPSAARR